jgi:hypothetical protein
MAISEARRFLLDSMAYGLWDGNRGGQSAQALPAIEVGESHMVDVTMEDESDNPETLYEELTKETGVNFEVEVDRNDDGTIFGTSVFSSAESALVTIKNQEEADYVAAKLKDIADY